MSSIKKQQRTKEYFYGRMRAATSIIIKNEVKRICDSVEQSNFDRLLKTGVIAEVRSERDLDTLIV